MSFAVHHCADVAKKTPPTPLSQIIQANVNAIIAARFPPGVKDTHVAKAIGFDNSLLWKVRHQAKVLSMQKIEELAAAFGETSTALCQAGRYDVRAADEIESGLTSPVTALRVTTEPSNTKAGVHDPPAASPASRGSQERIVSLIYRGALIDAVQMADDLKTHLQKTLDAIEVAATPEARPRRRKNDRHHPRRTAR